MESLICPVCKKGHLLNGTAAYTCNYYKNENDKCNFQIFKTVFKRELSENEILSLINIGSTPLIENFKTKEDKIFSCKLAIENGVVKPIFETKKLNIPCPKCKGEIEILSKSFTCQSAIGNDKKCDFSIPKIICKVSISEKEAVELIQNGFTDWKNCTSKKDKNFLSKFKLNEDYYLEFDTCISTCPKCNVGKIKGFDKIYSCSNLENCNFHIWRNLNGANILPKDVKDLCEYGTTQILNFKRKDGKTYQAKLSLNTSKSIILI